MLVVMLESLEIPKPPDGKLYLKKGRQYNLPEDEARDYIFRGLAFDLHDPPPASEPQAEPEPSEEMIDDGED